MISIILLALIAFNTGVTLPSAPPYLKTTINIVVILVCLILMIMGRG